VLLDLESHDARRRIREVAAKLLGVHVDETTMWTTASVSIQLVPSTMAEAAINRS
jgi:hypothetical protein